VLGYSFFDLVGGLEMFFKDIYVKMQGMKKYFIVIIVIVFIALISGVVQAPQQVACTMEAKLCPDGSSVGRTGPNCEFARCPEPDNNPGWKTFSDDAQGVSFQYPDQLNTTYIHSVDWPPQIAVANGPLICTESGSEIMQGGQTQQITINNRTYCLTKGSEGAAGSVYTQYAYAFPKNDKVLILTFTLQSVQCANHDDPKKTECENERTAFDISSTVDRMAQSVQLK
jgi:hypothetical protein